MTVSSLKVSQERSVRVRRSVSVLDNDRVSLEETVSFVVR